MAAARDHLVVLLNEQKELLQSLADQEGLLHSRKEDDQGRRLDKERAEEGIENLDAEIDKAKRLEITLAVAGTVKAGKSTTINAIIGTEALPNRARPMTALPTVIRHEANSFEPRLTVNNAATLDILAGRIAGKLEDKDRLAEVRTAHDVDMKPLIDALADGRPPAVGERQEGRARVFEALGRINDLLRLGRHEAVGEELSIENYDDLHEMPSLNVHFRCLADTAEASGSLALLDLPGFNEARLSDHLTKVLEEQLQKASAVLVVLDYTQLNTEASEELDALLDAVKEMMTDRVFILVNKFDQRTSNDPDEAETKAQIANDMMDGFVDPGHVYPVSGQFAYLASRALEALDRHGGLPSPKDEPWVDDFRSEAFGRDRTRLGDPVAVRKAANDLWADSGFDPVLNDVVVAAWDRAATLALQSALDKLKWYGDRVEDHLNVTGGSLTADARELESVIESIAKTADSLESIKATFSFSQQQTMDSIERGIEAFLREAGGRIDDQFHRLFDAEVNRIRHRHAEKQGAKKSKRSNLTLMNLFTSDQPDQPDQPDIGQDIQEQLMGEGKLTYYDRESYKKAVGAIHLIDRGIMETLMDEFMASANEMVSNGQKEIEEIFNQALQDMTEELRGKLEERGIKITLQAAEFKIDTKALMRDRRPNLDKHEKTYSVMKTRITSDFWDSVDPFDWFGWGKEEYEEERTRYEISRDETISQLKEAIGITMNRFQKSVGDQMKFYKQGCDEMMGNFGTVLEEYAQSLVDGLQKRKESKQRLEEVIVDVTYRRKRFGENRANVQDFESVVARMFE